MSFSKVFIEERMKRRASHAHNILCLKFRVKTFFSCMHVKSLKKVLSYSLGSFKNLLCMYLHLATCSVFCGFTTVIDEYALWDENAFIVLKGAS